MDLYSVVTSVLKASDPVYNGLNNLLTRVRVDFDNKGWRGNARLMGDNASLERWKLPGHSSFPLSVHFRGLVARTCRALLFSLSHDIASFYLVPFESKNKSPMDMDVSDLLYATTARFVANMVAYPFDVFCTRMVTSERDTSYPHIWFSILDQGRPEDGFRPVLKEKAGRDSTRPEPDVYLEDYADMLYAGSFLELALSALTETSLYLVLTRAEQFFGDMQQYQDGWFLVPIAAVGLAQGLVGYPLRTFQLRLQTSAGQGLGYSGNWERVKRDGVFSLYRGFWGWFVFTTSKILLQDAVTNACTSYIWGGEEDVFSEFES